MIHLRLTLELNYEVFEPGCDFIFNIHPAHTEQQCVLEEYLNLSQNIAPSVELNRETGSRIMRLHAGAGVLQVRYDATVQLRHHVANPAQIEEVAVAQLPADVLGFLYPSRYCQSDRLYKLAMREFGHLPTGYRRAKAIRDWVESRTTFAQNTSNSNTSAIDTLVATEGVCRDFAHLMIALCRASNIPARFTTGIDYGADPILGPTDFHAYVEAYLGGRWYIFDPSGTAIPMGFVRFGSGRDAADVAFATIFGPVRGSAPIITIQAISNNEGQLIIPYHCAEALSTDG